ncbi:MAG: LysR family transcriptional regulator [Oscillospiraceae bacterium]|nr:LysR family transcriptional regulator [Oscillospiraceae bacterium]
MFTLKHYVLEIAKSGSFSQAAENLYVSQPSLSASILRLEKRIGEPLFDRSVHPVRLTETGEEYVHTAYALAELEKNFQVYLEEHQKSQTGRLILGGSHLNLSYVIPPLLRQYRKEYPLVEISLVDGNIDRLYAMLSDGDIDLVVDSGSVDHALFEEYLYQPEILLLAVPDHFPCNEVMKAYQIGYDEVLQNIHADPGIPAPPLSLLGDTPFLNMTPDTDTGKREKRIFRRENFRPNSPFAFRQQLTAFHLACQGIGCTIISDMLVKSGIFRPKLTFYKLDETESFRYIKFYQKKGRRMTFAMRSFLICAGAIGDKG